MVQWLAQHLPAVWPAGPRLRSSQQCGLANMPPAARRRDGCQPAACARAKSILQECADGAQGLRRQLLHGWDDNTQCHHSMIHCCRKSRRANVQRTVDACWAERFADVVRDVSSLNPRLAPIALYSPSGAHGAEWQHKTPSAQDAKQHLGNKWPSTDRLDIYQGGLAIHW